MSKKKWNYFVAENCTYGTMICISCHQKIESGQFKVRETDDYYLVQHRHCSQDDKKWAELDAQKAKSIENTNERLAAFIIFRDKWQAYELDEEIEHMQAILNFN